MPKYIVAVTFESDTQPPKTFRGEVEGAGVPSAISKALRLAKVQFKGARWESLVVVLHKPELPKAGKPVERE